MSDEIFSNGFYSKEGAEEFLRFLEEQLDLLDQAREICLKKTGAFGRY